MMTADSLKVIAPETELKVSIGRINRVTETDSAIVLSDSQNPLFLLPKSEFQLADFVEALEGVQAAAVDQTKG